MIHDMPGQGRESSSETMDNKGNINIAVAGTGYVGLSIATLLSQHHHVTAVDVRSNHDKMCKDRRILKCNNKWANLGRKRRKGRSGVR